VTWLRWVGRVVAAAAGGVASFLGWGTRSRHGVLMDRIDARSDQRLFPTAPRRRQDPGDADPGWGN
jgi:hypothetical protein